ncbi:MAG: hypothetical protein ACE5J3_04985 [Methanosarcinales archaeon]
MQNEYFKKAEEYFKRGKEEYEKGLKERDVIKVSEGCEKVFHSLVELSNAIFSEHGIPLPEDHINRIDRLQEFGMHRLYGWAQITLHNYCYYTGLIKEKLINDAIDAIEQEIKKRR